MFRLCCILIFATAFVRSAEDPFELDAEDDTFLSADHTGRPAGRGTQPEMQLYGRTDHTLYRALIKFDLKKAPPGFKSAVLRLTCWNAHWGQKGTSFLRCHAVTSSWDQEDASWDQRQGKQAWKNVGGDWEPKALAASLFSGPLGGEKNRTFEFDITPAARAWQAQPGQNYGVVVMVEKGCSAELRFRSREAADAAEKPKLMLYYQKEATRDSFSLKPENIPPFEPYNPDAPSVSHGNRPDTVNIGDAVELKFSASGAKSPYVFSLASQPIPGMSLSPDGTLKGKPRKAGTFVLGVACTASNGKKATDWQRWVVVDPNAKPAAPPPAKKDEPAADEKKPAAPEKKPDAPKGPAEE
ncbi:MAG TPA: DNRLRE domain-containing protein [Planctomycetota bacterium]|nr:DNRLRE domain-containing protein [Planctomycetota bacterium]